MDPDARPEPGSPAPELRQDPHQATRSGPHQAATDRPDQLPLENETERDRTRPNDPAMQPTRIKGTGHCEVVWRVT